MQAKSYDREPRSDRLMRTEVPGIYRRGEHGSFVVIVRAGTRQVKRSAKTMTAAKRLKSQLTTDVGRGELDADSGVTFASYLTTWAGTEEKPGAYAGRTGTGIRPGTLRDYRRMLERHALPYFGSKRLRDIRPLHIRAYAGHLAEMGMAPSTVKLNLSPLRAMLATAVEDGILRSNPCSGLRLAQKVDTTEEEERAKALTEEQLAALLAQVPEKHRLMITTMAGTGTRISECIALRWGDFDFPNRRVAIRRRIYRGTVAPPESRYGRRTIPLSPGLAEALLERREAMGAAEEDLVFPSASGRAFEPSNLAQGVFKPAAERAGVGWASFHCLRHSYATMLFRNGANAVQAQRLLGHHSPAFTLACYVHLLPDDMPDVAYLDDVMAGGQTSGQTRRSQTEPDRFSRESAKTAA